MLVNNAHLTYCTNIHPGESWTEHFAAIQKYFPEVKRNCSPEMAMGIGLRLSHPASIELGKEENLKEFKNWLRDVDAYVFTMNGFPYGNFHHDKVKDKVHAPDWTTKERLDYTIKLFDLLVVLLPEKMDGGISTSPLSYRYWWNEGSAREEAIKKATVNIINVLEHLVVLKKNSNKILHLDIEPEPDGMLETGTEFIEWYEKYLLPEGIKKLVNSFKISSAEAEERVRDHIRLCYDVCHFAIGYEDHSEVISTLEKKGIKVGKVQISAALKADLPEAGKRGELERAFSEFNESTYLHQVVARKKNGSLIRYRDLPDALADLKNTDAVEWRSHFHVPVFLDNFGRLFSTRNDISELVNIFKKKQFTNHLEVETYTWEVLPIELKLPMEESISRELNWVKEELI